jgi:CubicO group peptidase (beta-lactamase class C family)
MRDSAASIAGPWLRHLAAVLLLTALVSPTACDDDSDLIGVDLTDISEIGDGSGFPGNTWDRAPTPKALGWSPGRLRDAREYSQGIGSGAVIIIDRGILVDEWGATSANWVVQSVRKSFMSALYGIYRAEGMIDLSATMAELGIDDSVPPSLTESERQATVEMLLQARSGIFHEAAAESQSMKDARPERGSHAPGTFYYYNNWDFNALATILTQLTGMDAFEAIEDRIARPLQMQDFRAANGFYHHEPVSEHPAYHFSMSARDMARFGLLYLRGGLWRGDPIVPEDWIARSTYPHSEANGNWDYGYMWWLAKPGVFGNHVVWQAAGGDGHAIWVVWDMNLVVVHRVNYATWRSNWGGAHDLLRKILYAKGG